MLTPDSAAGLSGFYAPEKPTVHTFVLYHANCADGFGAAYAAWHAIGNLNVHYIPVTHGEPLPEIPDDSLVYILDFSYSREILVALAARCTLRVIDHHATAQAALAGLEFATFDLSKSAAVLTWEYFASLGFVRPEVPKLLLYVQDRDLWKWQLYKSRKLSAALAMHPREFEAWAALDTLDGIVRLCEQGATVLAAHAELIRQIVERATEASIGGYAVPAANASVLHSEVCHELIQGNPDAPFVATYFDNGTTRTWSLRSNGKLNVGTLAASLGGGGHPNAAGFQEAINRIIL